VLLRLAYLTVPTPSAVSVAFCDYDRDKDAEILACATRSLVLQLQSV